MHINGKVLIVEDDPGVRTLMKDTLDNYGFHVTSCENGTQALHSSASSYFDVIITDYDLPGLNGL
jgi:CheY-like chemotaxis protein